MPDAGVHPAPRDRLGEASSRAVRAGVHPVAGPRPGPSPASDAEGEPDYARGVFVARRPGHEFAGSGTAGVAQMVLSQGFIGLLGAAFLLAMLLRPALGMSMPQVVVLTMLASAVGVLVFFRVRGGRRVRHDYTGAAYANTTDTRYRIRVVLPERRASRLDTRWIAAIEGDDPTPDEADLDYTAGGFEPVIVRLWMGMARHERRYGWGVALGMFAVAAAVGAVLMLNGGFGGVSGSGAFGMVAYAMIGLIISGGILIAELCLPVYVRVSPGKLDIFRYPFLGLGTPAFESIDLTVTPLCLDFGTYTLALEPPRPPGEPAPGLVLSKRWPYAKRHPEGYEVQYLTFLLSPGRAELARRVIQAARSTDPSVPLPEDRLLG